jgi:hypothetical protein
MALQVVASGLYRLLARRMRTYADAQARHIFRDRRAKFRPLFARQILYLHFGSKAPYDRRRRVGGARFHPSIASCSIFSWAARR